jgi:ketosteroid isomerase-like protein
MAVHPRALYQRSVTRTVCTLALAVFAVAQKGAAQSDSDRRTAGVIRQRRESSNAAIARHDTAGISDILAPNVVVVSSTSDVTVGRDANAARFAELFRTRPDVVYRRTPREVTVFAPWRMASESGTWTGSWTTSDGKVAIGGRYFAKWQEVEGRWRVQSETYMPERCSGSAYCARMP